MEREAFKKELQQLINRHSLEIGSDTPDYILADYLCKCLEAFDWSVNLRESWYGRPDETTRAQPVTANALPDDSEAHHD